jgi:hypothetical protein
MWLRLLGLTSGVSLTMVLLTVLAFSAGMQVGAGVAHNETRSISDAHTTINDVREETVKNATRNVSGPVQSTAVGYQLRTALPPFFGSLHAGLDAGYHYPWAADVVLVAGQLFGLYISLFVTWWRLHAAGLVRRWSYAWPGG